MAEAVAARPMVRISQGVPMVREWQMVSPVDFELLAGEHVAIVGRNGAGKTKLVDIITGRHPLKLGSIEYDFPSPTRRYVSENVKYLAFKDCYGAQTDSGYYLQQRWNQWDIEDERILLSSGELRKHSLSKILATEPCILILDNPFVGLDVASRRVLSRQFEEIIKGGKTSLIIVLSRCDEIPEFFTHVVEVKDEVVLPKVTLAEWIEQRGRKSYESAPDRQEGHSSDLGEEIVRLNRVSIRYGERTILKDLDWVVRKGERWSLMGPNGSGKSTLLGLVCADNPQSYACDISLFGHRRGTGESIWDIKKHIGYVSPELHRSCRRDITSEKIVANGLRDFHGMFTKATEDEIAVARTCLKKFGIAHLSDRSFLNMSSGEQRLVLLARAFVKNPDLLILDEPFHGLDDINVNLVKGIIRDFCEDPDKTLIIVTHYPGELPDCIDHNLTLSVNR
jgi:ABC-type molybdenum transport system, ATPase component/photorepair protein PhrA